MKALVTLVPMLFLGCSACGGNSTADSNVDDGDGQETHDDSLEAGDRDISPDPDLHDPSDGDPPSEDISEAVDQLPADCFSTLDAPVYEISPLWQVVEPDREPMPCEGCCRQVTFGYGNHSLGYDVWGKYIAYSFSDTPSPGIFHDELRFKKIDETNEYLVFSTDGALDIIDDPALYNDMIVFPHTHPFSEETMQCDLNRIELETGAGDTVFSFNVPKSDSTHSYWCPGGFSPMDMYGSYVVYESNRTGLTAGQQVYLLNIETGEERQISVSSGGVGYPRIWKNKVVYFGWYEGNAEVYMYDIDTGLTENLTYREAEYTEEINPAIWENLVAFRQGPTEAEIDVLGDVYMMDIAVRDFIPVCLNPAAVIGRVDIFDDLVAWTDLRNDPCPNMECRFTNTDIYYYRISTDSEFRVVPNPGVKGYARIWENRIFFAMKDAADVFNVFMVEAQ